MTSKRAHRCGLFHGVKEMESDLSSRIGHLLAPDALVNKTLMVVGLGSLGFPAVQHLAMSGVQRWILVDFDTFEASNLVKHPGMRKELGRMKIEISKDWILDRIPDAQVTCLPINITTVDGKKAFKQALEDCDAVMVTTDNKNSRLVANRIACELQTPMIVGTVYRTGFGGDSYLYHPESTGCFECFIAQSEAISIERTVAESKAATETEQAIQEARYGRIPDPTFGLSGLASDIASIAALVSRMTLTALLDASVNDSFLEAVTGDSSNLSRLESHLLELPYNIRGGKQPPTQSSRTVWLDSNDGQRYGIEPLCGECSSSVDPNNDRCCSWCGAIFDEKLSAQKGAVKTDIQVNWRPIPPMERGHGVNHVSMITRRHLIDDAEFEGHETSRLRIAFQPFQMQSNYVGKNEDCPWCKRGEEE